MLIGITCSSLAPFIRIIAYLINMIKYIIPILLIVLVTYDFIRAMLEKDEAKMKEATNKSVKRVAYAIVIFVVPTVVSLIFNLLTTGLSTDTNMQGFSKPSDWAVCVKTALRKR